MFAGVHINLGNDPPTCGMTTAESRDLSVATYSVESLTGIARASCTFTGIAPGPAACGLCALLPEQPTVAKKGCQGP